MIINISNKDAAIKFVKGELVYFSYSNCAEEKDSLIGTIQKSWKFEWVLNGVSKNGNNLYFYIIV